MNARDPLFLRDILRAISAIERYTACWSRSPAAAILPAGISLCGYVRTAGDVFLFPRHYLLQVH